jgi:hypothetical protein
MVLFLNSDQQKRISSSKYEATKSPLSIYADYAGLN